MGRLLLPGEFDWHRGVVWFAGAAIGAAWTLLVMTWSGYWWPAALQSPPAPQVQAQSGCVLDPLESKALSAIAAACAARQVDQEEETP
jgi:hypothetical protein